MAGDEKELPFGFLGKNRREGKPRKRGLTEIRGPYYSPMGKRYLEDVLETMGAYVDSLKFAGGSFALMPRGVVRELIELAHRYGVEVSTGGVYGVRGDARAGGGGGVFAGVQGAGV